MVSNILYDIFERVYVEDLSVFVVFKCENLIFFPKLYDLVKPLPDLAFHKSAVVKIVKFIYVIVEFEIVKVTKAKLGVQIVDILAYNTIKTFPVVGLHFFRFQILNREFHSIHFPDSVD